MLCTINRYPNIEPIQYKGMEFYYSPDLINNRFGDALLPTQTTDYFDFIWQKYFDSKPTEFQLQYLSRQQGKTWAILHAVILIVNGVIPGKSHYTLYTRSHSTIRHYMDVIHTIINIMKGKKFEVVKSKDEVVNMIEFSNGGKITFIVIGDRTDMIFMDC